MKKIIKIFFTIIVVFLLIIVIVFVYLNFVYLPQKVKSEGATYLEKKSQGQIKAKSIEYIPFKGVKLKDITILSKAEVPIFTMDRLYFNVHLLSLIKRNELNFRGDLYLPQMKSPITYNGLYYIRQRQLDLDCKIPSNIFVQKQDIYAKMKLLVDQETKTEIQLDVNSTDLNIQGNLYIKDRDLHLEKLSVKVFDSTLDLIGDIQNLTNPLLNIYVNLELALKDFAKVNPQYSKLLSTLKMEGRCQGEIYLSAQANNPEVGLKLNAKQIQIEKTKIEDVSIVAKKEDKKVTLLKSYAKLYEGEINLEGTCRLDAQGLPATLNLNVFNLQMNNIIADIKGKEVPVHGRLFSLVKLNAPLRTPKDVEGTLWISLSGSNILEFPLFKGITDILRFPQLSNLEFKEASGNFSIAKQAARTGDFKIVGNNLVILYKGYIDFAGNLSFDVEPSFSPSFLAAPTAGNILGIFIDSTGNFMGEIKLKGNLKDFRHTFKPFSKEKLFPKGIEELQQLFKF